MKFRFLTIILVVFSCLAANNCCVSSDTNAIANRLKRLEKALPLPYNDTLVHFIHHYEALGIPKAFVDNEAFIEAELQRRNMPNELKYLPVALSDMQKDFTSNDRSGTWALPTLVAFRHGLEINDAYDERLSIKPATIAALDYLSDLHDTFGDWWISILAFSNSPNALQQVIVQSESFLDLWDFHTQEILPNSDVIANMIACCFVYGSFTPEQKAAALAQYEQLEAKKNQEMQVAKVEPAPISEPDSTRTPKPEERYSTYTVKKGDYLGKIANRYHVTVDSLMKWNNLNNDLIREGQQLKIRK